jgi:hypothetical protein
MATRNLTNLIMRKVDAIIEENKNLETNGNNLSIMDYENKAKLIRYYVSTDLEKKIGTETVERSDIKTVPELDRGQFIVNYPYADGTLIFTVIRNKDGIDITAAELPSVHVSDPGEIPEGSYENFMKIRITNGIITNDIKFAEDDLEVVEEMYTDFDRLDAKSFALRRSENNNLVYGGTLSPILYAKGNKEYFQFKCIGQDGEGKNSSVIQKIIDSLTSNSLIPIPVSRMNAPIIQSSDVIYSTLRENLEKNRIVKKPVHPVQKKKID